MSIDGESKMHEKRWSWWVQLVHCILPFTSGLARTGLGEVGGITDPTKLSFLEGPHKNNHMLAFERFCQILNTSSVWLNSTMDLFKMKTQKRVLNVVCLRGWVITYILKKKNGKTTMDEWRGHNPCLKRILYSLLFNTVFRLFVYFIMFALDMVLLCRIFTFGKKK